MAKAKLTIRLQTSSSLDSQTILLNESIMKQWKLTANQTVTLQFGSLRKEVTLVPIAKSTTLRIHPDLASEMNLYDDAKLSANYAAETDTFHLGPLIAVMVSRVHSQSSEPFGANTSFCRELTLACEKFGGLVYFFSPGELPAESGRLSGWFYDQGWKKRSFPIPNVVYNRLTKRRLENSNKVQQFIQEVKSTYQSHVFNEKFLNKTEVFQILKQVPEVQLYLPESYAYKSSTLQAMCAKYSTVYLKPVTGSLGKGIIRISKAPKGYLCHFNQSSGVRKLSFASLKELTQTVGRSIKKSRYQIQQGIRLIQSNGNPIDFRVLVQKNSKGKWAITSTVGRIAGSHTFVSNLARGGTLTSVRTALARGGLGTAQRTSVFLKLQKAALNLAVGLDDKIPEHFAELGIDLAVDMSGRVWLLEINSKPSKEKNSSLSLNKIRPSVRRIVHYSQYLSKL